MSLYCLYFCKLVTNRDGQAVPVPVYIYIKCEMRDLCNADPAVTAVWAATLRPN